MQRRWDCPSQFSVTLLVDDGSAAEGLLPLGPPYSHSQVWGGCLGEGTAEGLLPLGPPCSHSQGWGVAWAL